MGELLRHSMPPARRATPCDGGPLAARPHLAPGTAAWMRLRDAILTALEPHPQALADVIAALEREHHG